MQLKRNLGLLEAVGLSVSILAPTLAMSFNTIFAVQAAGAAAPLAFLIGTAAMLLVGLCFVAFERRVSNHGSVYSYIGHTFGPRWGFVAGWSLLFFYTTIVSTCAALFGNGVSVLLKQFGVQQSNWFLLAILVLLIAGWLTWRDAKVAARGMLAAEVVSIAIILILAIRILTTVPLSWAPMHPDATHGWSGIGYGMVFAVFSFGGFEGAAMLGQETNNPRRNIPIAILGTLVFAGLFYVLVVYAQVVGYGVNNLDALTHSDSPLSSLAERYLSRRYSIGIDLSIIASTFACTLGTVGAASRMLRILSVDGTKQWFADLDPKHNTPTRAIVMICVCNLAGMLLWGLHAGALTYAAATATCGTLALVLLYVGVGLAEAVEALRSKRLLGAGMGVISALLLLWPLWNNIYPVPSYPANLWPYLVAGWILIGGVYAVRKMAPEGN
ncbi:APC family permease [Granulicella sp. S190]|uniref:APC family permease n=1 Tax=Granulicella sp. S190 TaxID=1747226 RepID=UPI00131E7262|nr:APC family permease [Granulicella sp. S190]